MRERLLPILFLLCVTNGAQARALTEESRPSVRLIRRAAEMRQWKETATSLYTRAAAEQQTYLSTTLGFSMRFPKDWTLTPLDERGGNITALALFLSPLASENDTSRENVSLLAEDLSASSKSLEEYTQSAIQNEQTLFTDYTLLSSQNILLDGKAAHLISYSASFQGKTLMFEQVWSIRKSAMLVWTLAAPPETYDTFAPVFHHMLSTITFSPE